MIQRIQPAAVPQSNAPFSQVVLDDRYAYLAGLGAADFPSGIAVLGDVGKETEAVMNTVVRILEEQGLSVADIVRSDVHLSDLEDFDAMDAAYRRYGWRHPLACTGGLRFFR